MSTPLLSRPDALRAHLAAELARCGIPGAAVAVLHRGELVEAAAGVLDASTGAPVTTDSLFQAGSVTKTFTATLVLQLVEQGRIALDDPVRKHLPWLALASRAHVDHVTIAQLLSHTSGIDGDFFPEIATIEGYVRDCAQLGAIHAPGAGPSYTNAAFVILAAMLQEITGQAWDQLLRARILEPLQPRGMTTDFAALPRDRKAVGHGPDPQTRQFVVAKFPHLPLGMAPTGASLHATAADLARFGEVFLRGGITRGGVRLLQEQTIARSREVRAVWPTAPWLGLRMGLGWMLYDWDGRALFGHDGATIGQYAFLRVAPDADLVVALLCNGVGAKNLYYGLMREIFASHGIRMPTAAPLAPDLPFDAQRVTGTYRCKSGIAAIGIENGTLMLRTTPLELTHVVPAESWPLLPVAADACRIVNPALDVPDLVVFHDFVQGRARYAMLNMRDFARSRASPSRVPWPMGLPPPGMVY